jgi:hypothetical protein
MDQIVENTPGYGHGGKPMDHHHQKGEPYFKLQVKAVQKPKYVDPGDT